jgi:hypothetical protein
LQRFWKIRKAIDNFSKHGKISPPRIILIRIYTFLPIVEKIGGGEARKSRKIIRNLLNLNEILIIA